MLPFQRICSITVNDKARDCQAFVAWDLPDIKTGHRTGQRIERRITILTMTDFLLVVRADS